MYKQKKIIAVIPARGGSKGLPGKNTRLFCGKPLVAWSIGQAVRSAYIDKVVVSTESAAIAAIARRYSADVPFLRPAKLASDTATSVAVVLDALLRFEKSGEFFDVVMLLQPTSPLRTTGDIDASLRWFFARRAKAVVSVCVTEHSPLWCNTLPKDYSMKDFVRRDVACSNRQKLPVFYRLNGAIYAADCQYLKKQKNFFGVGTTAYIMPKERSVDIDSRYDFDVAEFLKSKHKR